MTQALRDAARSLLPKVTALRHELHAYPEIRFEEHWTSGRISAWLEESGVPHTRGHAGGTGIVAEIPGGSSELIVLRADMDALEIEERTGVSYASQIQGKMHACGHDGHSAILCGVARLLWEARDMLPCGVRCIFQPAEEEAAGGRLIVNEGLLDGARAAFALHGWPSIPTGRLMVGPGAVMASADDFHIEIVGRGGHAADPASTIDPVVIAAHLVTALQTVVSRSVNPWDAVVLSVTRLEAGHTGNIIPDCARVDGTLRTLTETSRREAMTAIERIALGVCAAWGASAEVRLASIGYPASVNEPGMAAYAQRVAARALGEDLVSTPPHPYMTAEDFGYYLQKVPGAFAFLGTGARDGASSPGLHTPYYNFNDESLEPGMLYLASLALEFDTALESLA